MAVLAGGGPTAVRVGLLVSIVLAWHLMLNVGILNPLFIAGPTDVARAVGNLVVDTSVRSAMRMTVSTMAYAFVIGSSLGLLVGVLLGVSKTLHDAYMAPLVFLFSTPKSMYLPIFLLTFGIGQTGAIAFGAFNSFFIVAVTTVGGVHLVELRHLKAARAFGANRLESLRFVVLPAATPGLFAALWHGIKQAVGGVLTAELFVSIGGIGTLLRRYTDSFQPDRVLGLIVIVSLVAIVAGSLWNRLERRLTRWRQAGGTTLAVTDV